MSITNINNSLIQVSNPILADIDSIEHIDIKAVHNCCAEYSQRIVINDSTDYKLCTAKYCNYSGQDQSCGDKFPQNCVHPQGSYYFKLSELKMRINGVSSNILSRSYNLTQESEIELLKNNMVSLGIDIDFTVTVSYTNQGYLCVELAFIDLPSGVKPEYFILRNVESCFIKEDFNCLSVIKNNECVEWGYTFIQNKVYTLDKLVLLDGTEIPLNINMNLIDLSIESASMLLMDELAELLQDYVITYDIKSDSFTILFDKEISYIYGTIDGLTTAIQLQCTSNSKVPSVSEYSTTLDFTKHSAIYAVNVEDEAYVTPINLLSTPLLKENISTLIAVLKTIDPAITGTVEFLSTNVYRVTIKTYTKPIVDIILHNNYTDYKAFGMVASALSNIGSTYNSDLIEYIHNNLYIKPKFFSATDLFVDGVYAIDVNIVTSTAVYSHKYCIFVFNNQCLINSLYLKDKELGLKAMLLHTMLVENSNCGCDCATSCLLYSDLYNLLYNSKCATNQ